MYRMLIADDEMIERAVLYKMLNKNLEGQCEIYQAENGRQALELYEKEKIQIAVLDIEMPGINGIQAAEKIREKDKDCVIIIILRLNRIFFKIRFLRFILKELFHLLPLPLLFYHAHGTEDELLRALFLQAF